MRRIDRRRFIQRSIAAAGGVFALGTEAYARVLGANETIRVGVAGLNGRGESHVDAFSKLEKVEVACLIDPDTRTFEKRIRQLGKRGGRKPACVQDVRKALEDKDLDVISVATTNHWHSLITIWACQAGKDVYVEKPLSHNVHEGRIAVETARRHERIVQHGTQSRASGGWARVAAIIKSGKLGKLLVSRGLCYKGRGTIGSKDPRTPPSEMDFDIWLGPAASRPFHENLVHYNWHWFWDFGNGDIGNQGVHQMDLARWAIPGATLPRSVLSLGGRFGYTDQGETPNTQVSVMDFGETQLVFEVRGLKTDGHLGEKVGNIFHLEGGTIVGNDRFIPRGSEKSEPLPRIEVDAPRGPGGGIFENFIACVRSRKREDLHADVLEGHHSSALCHLANISYRLGESVPFQPRAKALGGQKEALEALERMEAHLSGGNKLSLEGLSLRVGRKLQVDAAKETITGDPEAEKLLTRSYRAPFTVPDRVA